MRFETVKVTTVKELMENLRNENNLQDEDIMSFGKHKGRVMGDINPSYFRWLWNNGANSQDSPIANYIRSKLERFKREDKDGIWDKDKLK